LEKITALERANAPTSIATDIGRLGAMLLFFAALGVIYVIGLEPMPWAHDTFHDTRHATGFPCH